VANTQHTLLSVIIA